jgi:hypothetical protein
MLTTAVRPLLAAAVTTVALALCAAPANASRGAQFCTGALQIPLSGP